MIYTKNTKKAMKIAYDKHAGQYDKSGIPYIYHPIHIAEQMDDENSTIVALLHDVLEDTNTTIDEIKKYEFDIKVLEALKTLNHSKNLDYFEYIKLVSQNEIAKKVKIADLMHNLDISRLSKVTQKDLDRVKKYEISLEYLKKI